jgi:hypothetical protein
LLYHRMSSLDYFSTTPTGITTAASETKMPESYKQIHKRFSERRRPCRRSLCKRLSKIWCPRCCLGRQPETRAFPAAPTVNKDSTANSSLAVTWSISLLWFPRPRRHPQARCFLLRMPDCYTTRTFSQRCLQTKRQPDPINSLPRTHKTPPMDGYRKMMKWRK